MSGPTLVRGLVITYPDVEPGATVKLETKITPKVSGDQKLIATFTSRELVDIVGSTVVKVSE